MQERIIENRKATDQPTKRTVPLPSARLAGNQAILQYMLWGDEANDALDEVIASEDPDWIKIINGLQKRPSYAPGQVMTVWKAAGPAALSSGAERVKCASCGDNIDWYPKTSRKDVWDMGHKAGDEYRKLLKAFADHKITFKDFLSVYQDPSQYQPEHPKCNRSHKYESP